MNKLDSIKRAQVVSCLFEGCSIRATVRMTGVAKKTIMRVLVEIGEVCADYQDRVFRNLHSRRLQLDELWSWIYCKEKNRTEEIARKNPDAGDVWLWVCVDADSKLVPSWMLGRRDLATAKEFVADIASRLKNRVQITCDAYRPYLMAIEDEFGTEVDFAQLQKIYGAPQENEKRYSPAVCIGCDMKVVTGDPDPKHVSTSYVERQNWTVRTTMRRYTRLSNGFSRKLANHAAATALNYFAYNFIKIHRTLRTSPAMAAGVTDSAVGRGRLGCSLGVVRAEGGKSGVNESGLAFSKRAGGFLDGGVRECLFSFKHSSWRTTAAWNRFPCPPARCNLYCYFSFVCGFLSVAQGCKKIKVAHYPLLPSLAASHPRL